MRFSITMQTLWPRTETPTVLRTEPTQTIRRRTVNKPNKLVSILLLMAAQGSLASSSVVVPWRTNVSRTPSWEGKQRLSRVPSHISEFRSFSEPLALPKCEEVRPPEALLTPDPLVRAEDDDLLVRVSFIVGSDGHVHSAFILKSGGPEEDERVLRAVREWRYRPALCNGVPTEAEARVRFSVR